MARIRLRVVRLSVSPFVHDVKEYSEKKNGRATPGAFISHGHYFLANFYEGRGAGGICGGGTLEKTFA